MRAGIQITEGVAWARGKEAVRLRPQQTICATVDWPLPPDDSEAVIMPDVISALSQALAACGSVAFRHEGPLAGMQVYDPPAKKTLKSRLLELVGLAGDSFEIVVSNDPTVIAAMFAYDGWGYAMQAALIFDPAADPSPIIAALRQDLDWRQRPLTRDVRLLFGPGHDGDFAVIAAATHVWLERFKTALYNGGNV